MNIIRLGMAYHWSEAIKKNDISGLELLIDDQNFDLMSMIILFAAQEGSAEIVLLLLNRKPDLLTVSSTSGWNLIHYAARRGQEDLARTLAGLGPHLLFQASYPVRRTPLHFAAEKGHENVVRVMLEEQAKLAMDQEAMRKIRGSKHNDITEARDSLGLTPLHLAARNGHEAVARLLLAHRPELIGVVDSSNNTVLHEAVINCSAEFVLELWDKQPVTMNTSLHTPLHRAVIYSNLALLEKLQWRVPFDELMEAHVMCDKSYLPYLRVFMTVVEPPLACLHSDVMQVVFSYIKPDKRDAAPSAYRFRPL